MSATMKDISSKALVLKVSGEVLHTDIYKFADDAKIVLSNIKTVLETDNDFSEAKQNMQDCKTVEKFIEKSLSDALAEMKEVNEVTNIANGLKDKFAKTRLILSKLVISEETKRKSEITNDGICRVKFHLDHSQVQHAFSTDIAAINNSVKNKRSIEKMKDAVEVEVAAQIKAIEDLKTIYISNLAGIQNAEIKYPGLFPDFKKLAVSPKEVVEVTITSRINEFKFKQHQNEDAERKAKEAADLKANQELEDVARKAAEKKPVHEEVIDSAAEPLKEAQVFGQKIEQPAFGQSAPDGEYDEEFEILTLKRHIEESWGKYHILQKQYSQLTGKEHVWFK